MLSKVEKVWSAIADTEFDNGHVGVVLWPNGEGMTIDAAGDFAHGNGLLNLSWVQWYMLKKLVKKVKTKYDEEIDQQSSLRP